LLTDDDKQQTGKGGKKYREPLPRIPRMETSTPQAAMPPRDHFSTNRAPHDLHR
jgi:hypothetical protein